MVGEAVDVLEAGPHTIEIADPAMARLYELARRLARSPFPILIQGETGTGKELAAAAIHAFSPRANGPFVSVNCAAIAETLAESELFGHGRGAFSGAIANKIGHIEAAHGGTLFLDEIGELSLCLQAKLLRALESGEVTRVGDVKSRRFDFRIVAATNRDLEVESNAGRFRSDLFFRLAASQLTLLPLRDRPRDLACLAERFIVESAKQAGRAPLGWSVSAHRALFVHDWPGNIRELRNAVRFAVSSVADDESEIELRHLPPAVLRSQRAAASAHDLPLSSIPASADHSRGEDWRLVNFRPIADEVRELERDRMVRALRATRGVQNRAADLIEMPLRTFATKLRRYDIAPSDWAEED